MNFELISEYQPTGDQPEAIAQPTEGAGRSPATNFIKVTPGPARLSRLQM